MAKSTQGLIRVNTRTIVQPAKSWGATSAPEQREKDSRLLASLAYVEFDKLIQYVDRSGAWKDYCPTPDDAKQIEARVKVEEQMNSLSEHLLESALQWWMAGIVAFVLGWSSALTRRP